MAFERKGKGFDHKLGLSGGCMTSKAPKYDSASQGETLKQKKWISWNLPASWDTENGKTQKNDFGEFQKLKTQS